MKNLSVFFDTGNQLKQKSNDLLTGSVAAGRLGPFIFHEKRRNQAAFNGSSDFCVTKAKKSKNLLTNRPKQGIIKRSAGDCKRHFADECTEKYSRGRRGAPAKGVGRLYRRESSNLSFSAMPKGTFSALKMCLLSFCDAGFRNLSNIKNQQIQKAVFYPFLTCFSLLKVVKKRSDAKQFMHSKTHAP